MNNESRDQTNNQKRTLASYVLAGSIFCLSAALFYFTWTLVSISEQIPSILTSVEQTSNKIEPIFQNASEINQLIPPIIEEVSEIRKLVTPVLDEIRLTREQIPQIIQTTDKVIAETSAIRPLIPQALNEVKLTREAIPPMLDRADVLVANIRKAGKDASQGAVTGIVSGIVTAPFQLIGNLGKRMFTLSKDQVKALSEQDMIMMDQAMTELLPSDDISESRSWNNPDTGVSGNITLIKIKTIDDQTCKQFHMKIRKNKQTLVDEKTTTCLNNDGEWEQRK